MTSGTRIDTREMVVVHTAFRREFEAAPAIVRGVAAGDRARAQRVGDHVQLLLDMLHHHHAGEDELLWPKLLRAGARRSSPPRWSSWRASTRASTPSSTRRGPRWTAGAPPAGDENREALAAAIERLTPLLVEHLSRRGAADPAAGRRVPHPGRVGRDGGGGHGRRSRKKQLPMVFGMLMEDGDPEVLRAMLGPRAAAAADGAADRRAADLRPLRPPAAGAPPRAEPRVRRAAPPTGRRSPGRWSAARSPAPTAVNRAAPVRASRAPAARAGWPASPT